MYSAMLVTSRVHSGVSSSCGCFNLIRVFQQSPTTTLAHLKPGKSSLHNQNFGRSKFSTLARSWSETTHNKQWSPFRQLTTRNKKISYRFMSEYPNPLTVNTNVLNNVILYRFEKTLRFKLAAGFAIFTLMGCWFMVDNVYMVLCKDLFNREIPITERLMKHIFPLTAICVGAIAGPLITATIWLLTVRTIKYVILRKGGKAVTFVTYHPFRQERTITVPIEKVSCESARYEKKSYVSLKLKDYKFKFIVERDGHFVNPELFDCTIGVKR